MYISLFAELQSCDGPPQLTIPTPPSLIEPSEEAWDLTKLSLTTLPKFSSMQPDSRLLSIVNFSPMLQVFDKFVWT